MQKATIIFDLDYTLLDTVAFKAAMAADGLEWEEGTVPPLEAAKHAAESWRYLFAGARELLEGLRALPDARLVLLTFGPRDWQLAKVEGTGLAGLFDQIIVTDAPKAGLLPQMASSDEGLTIVINDNCEEMQAMREVAPHCLFVVKRGPKGVPDDIDMPVVDTIDEIVRVIEGETGWNI